MIPSIAIEPDAEQLHRGLLRLRRLVGEEEQRLVRRHHPAGPVADLAVRRPRFSAPYGMSRRECRRRAADPGSARRRRRARRPRPAGSTAASRVASSSSGGPALLTRFIRAKYGGVSGMSASTAATNASRSSMLQHRVLRALARDRRRGLLADAGAAERSGAVARMHLDPIVERHDPLRASRTAACASCARLRLAEQIGPPDAADEEQVAGEQPRRLAGRFGQDRDVLRRVSRRVQERQRHVADRQRLAVARLRGASYSRSGAGPGVDARAGCGQLARAGHEVGVHVRLDRGDDGRAELPRRRDVDRRRRAADRSRPPASCDRSRRETTPARVLRRRSAGTYDRISGLRGSPPTCIHPMSLRHRRRRRRGRRRRRARIAARHRRRRVPRAAPERRARPRFQASRRRPA